MLERNDWREQGSYHLRLQFQVVSSASMCGDLDRLGSWNPFMLVNCDPIQFIELLSNFPPFLYYLRVRPPIPRALQNSLNLLAKRFLIIRSDVVDKYYSPNFVARRVRWK